MNREEFMAKLKALLGDIPAEEREEALQYYEDYFDDAGACLLYTSPSPRDPKTSRMPSSA